MNKDSAASFPAHLAATAMRLIQIERRVAEANRRVSEAVWAHILDDTIRESDWFVNRDLLPHQYATGHQTLYVLFRILNESHPAKILCVGKGVMAQVISQYEHSVKGVEVRKARCRGDFHCDLVCVEMGSSATVLPRIKLSEHGTIIISDTHRVLKNDDIDKYANLIRDTGRMSVVGRYEGFGICYVVTGEDKVFLVSM